MLNVDFSAFKDTLAKLKDDVCKIVKFKSRFAPTADLDHAKILVGFLENQIYLFTECYLEWIVGEV